MDEEEFALAPVVEGAGVEGEGVEEVEEVEEAVEGVETVEEVEEDLDEVEGGKVGASSEIVPIVDPK